MNPTNMNPPMHQRSAAPSMMSGNYGSNMPYGKPASNHISSVMNGSSTGPYNPNINGGQSFQQRPIYQQPSPPNIGEKLSDQVQNLQISEPRKQIPPTGGYNPSAPTTVPNGSNSMSNQPMHGPPVPPSNHGPPSHNMPRPTPSSVPYSSSAGTYVPPSNRTSDTGTGAPRMPQSNFQDPSRTHPVSKYSNLQSMPGPVGSGAHHEIPPPNSVSGPLPSQNPREFQNLSIKSSHPGSMHAPQPQSMHFQNPAHGTTSSQNLVSGPTIMPPNSRLYAPNAMSGHPNQAQPNSLPGSPSVMQPNSLPGPPSGMQPNSLPGPPSGMQSNSLPGPPSGMQSNSLPGPPNSVPSNSMPGSHVMSQQGLPGVTHSDSMQGPPGNYRPNSTQLPNAPLSSISGPPNMHQPNQILNSVPSQRMMQGQLTSMNATSFNPGIQPLQMPPGSSNLTQPHSMNRPPGPMTGPPMSSGLPMGNQSHYPQHCDHQQNQNRQPGYGGPAPLPQPARRLDPDQMPSPIQVMEDDRKTRSGFFKTNLKGNLPPLVSTKFCVQDEGNCSPRFMRSTIYSVPSNPDMLKQTAMPFAICISPFANLEEGEHPPPLVNFGPIGPVRCNRCKAYMCPFMQFIDGGRRFQCIFCKCTTEVPAEYFSHLDHTGLRTDKYQRPELCLGSYEFVATLDYCKNNKLPSPPAFIFMIDVSYNSVKSGVVHLLCQNMKSILKSLPTDEDGNTKIKVGFVTYGGVIHFYNVKESLVQPQMLVVPDVQDMFMPLLDGFLVNADEAESVIDSLMEQIPAMFGETRETETILGPVIQAGLEALKAADCSGKLLIFHSSLPIADAPGKLKNRDDRKVLGTDKEKSVLSPQDKFYNQLGQDCVAAGCSVDLFTFPNSYIDVATIGQVCTLSGGQVYKYSYFQSEVDGQRFLEDLKHDLERPIAFDAIMRVRTSTGVRPTDFFGNYFMSNTTDVELASVDCDKAVTIEIKHDDKLTEEDGVYIQAATLYTCVSGQRRLRIHNLSLNCCSQMADLFRNCELDSLMNFFSKQSMRVILEQNPKAVKENYIERGANILACYRKNCASPSSAGQLILPEGMKLLPLYTNCLIKSDALAGGSDMTTDDRSFLMQYLNYADVSSSLAYLYPRLFSVHDMDLNEELPKLLRCSGEKIQDNGAYLLENGIYLFLWIGLGTDPSWIQNVFGVASPAQINVEQLFTLPELDNEVSVKIRQVIDVIRSERSRHLKFTVVRQRDKLDLLFRNFLVEDKAVNGGASYVDFLCHMHKEIRSQLS